MIRSDRTHGLFILHSLMNVFMCYRGDSCLISLFVQHG
jgi:hypothetical protein